MRPRGIPAALAAACAIVLAVAAGAQARPPADEAVRPAPPPVGYCRVIPPEWPAFPASPAPVPDLTPFQDYRAGLGIDGTARGAGVTIADIEYEWSETHGELAHHGLAASGDSGLDAAWRARDHGTAVLGLLGGSDDGRGVTGLAPDATLAPRAPDTGDYRPWLDVAAAAATLEPGDVLLIELQAGLATPSGTAYAPIEVYPAMRRAIRAAVDAGIVVVQPAGNSGSDIGAVLTAAGETAPWLLGPEAPNHSGALIVGAGGGGRDESETPDLARAAVSNHGPRVDLQGYGGGVVTSGYGDAPGSAAGDAAYTTCFDGTSSAAATVAAAAALVQGAEIARDGTPLTPAQVRALLVATGTPQAGPGGGAIGPRPDVADAIAALADLETEAPPAPGPDAPPAVDAPAPPPPAPPLEPAPPAPPAPVAPALATSAPRTVPAATGLTVRADRRARTLTLRFAGLAPRAVVRVGGRAVRMRAGRVVVRLPRAATRVVVTAPPRAGVRRRAAVWRVVVPERGRPLPARLR